MTPELSNTQIRVSSDMSSVWNFCSHSSDMLLLGRPVVALQNVSCFLRLETSGNKAGEKKNLKQGYAKCLGDMSVHAFYCES